MLKHKSQFGVGNAQQWLLIILAAFLPSTYAAGINDTGVTTCSDNTKNGLPCPVENFPRQDAEYGINSLDLLPLDPKGQAIATTNVKGHNAPITTPACVRDQGTNLTWDVGATPELTAAQIGDYVTALNASRWCGFTDWRLPTLWELQSIVREDATSPVVDRDFFPTVQPRPIWSATKEKDNAQQQWVVDFNQGVSGLHSITELAGVRLVHGDNVTTTLVATADATVTDANASLMWAKCSEGRTGADCKTGKPLTLSWEKALQTAEKSQRNGFKDWRLPNKKELESLLDFARHNSKPTNLQLPTNATAAYWTATPSQHETGTAWAVDVLKGNTQTAKMNSCLTLRLVRELKATDAKTTSQPKELQPKDCTTGDCIMWEDVCTGGWEDVCISYTDVCNGYEDVCNGYEDVCDSYTTVCDSYTDVCDEYVYICTLYDDWGNCVDGYYDYSQCSVSHQECATSHEECSTSHQECTGGWTQECTGGWTQECDQTESQCSYWEQQCTGGYYEYCTYTVTPGVGTGGSVSPPDAQTIDADSTASFTVTPDNGYTLDGYVGGDCPQGSWDGYGVWTTGAITYDCTVAFSFTPIPTPNYTVTATAGAGGSVNPTDARVDEYATANFTVTPDAGYTTDTTVGGDCPAGNWDGNGTWTTGSITAACSVEFSFTPIPPPTYTVTATAGAGGSVNPTDAQVDEYATSSFTVTPNAGYTTDTTVGGDCPAGNWDGNGTWTTGSITAACSVEFSFTPITYTITATAGSGGSVDPTTAQVTYNGEQIFTVYPDSGYVRDEIVGGDCPQGTWNGNDWTTGPIIADCTVEFSFTLITYTVTPSANPAVGGTVSPNSAQTVTNGDTQTFTVTANAGYVRNPTVTGTCPQGTWSSNVWTTGNIYSNCTVIFGFIKTYTVTPSANPIVGGNVSPSGVQTVMQGATKAFTVTPNVGYTKNAIVTGTCPQGSWAGNVWTTGAVTANCNVVFGFTIVNYTVTASAGTGGTVTPSSAQAAHGTTKTFTVTPNVGVGYTKNAAVTGNCPQGSWAGNVWTTGAITANCNVVFGFTITNYTVTASAGTGGTVTPSSAQAAHGMTKAFTVTPLTGYTKNNAVTGTCPVGSWAGNIWTTGAITANCTVGFSFTPIKLSVTPTAGTGGSVSPNGVQTVPYGATQAFTVTPNTGYTKNAAVTGTCPQGSWNGNIWTTGAIKANCTLGFGFTINPYTVTATAGTGGSVNPGVKTVTHGATSAFTVTPATGFTRNNAVTGTCPDGNWNGNVWTTGIIVANCTLNFSFADPNTPPTAWLYPVNPRVLVGKPLVLNIHVKTDGLTVGAYDFTLQFDASKLVLDTGFQNSANACTDGVCPAANALASNTISGNPQNGIIRLAGFDTTGKGPSNDLDLLSAHFIAKQTLGQTPVDLTLNNFTTTQGEAIGTIAKGATVVISPGNCGDADGTGIVNIVDALSVGRYTVGLPPPPTVNPTLADVDRNGAANIVDAMHIARYSVGLTLPANVCAVGAPL